jgi:hypothetical protein
VSILEKGIIGFSLLLFLFRTSVEAKNQPKVFISPEVSVQKQTQLMDMHGYNKSFPDNYKLQCLVALSYYPELDSIPIEFVFKKIKTTMASRPRVDFIVKKKDKRIYRIVINNQTKGFEGVMFNRLSFNAQVGVIGHELAHIIDYMPKSNFSVIGIGIGYLFRKYKKRLEHVIDQITIDHGLGFQLYEYSYHVLNYSHASQAYKRYKKEIYLRPREIMDKLLKREDMYENELLYLPNIT